MKDLHLSIEINRLANDIFDFTLNPENTPKWVDFIAEETTDEWPAKLGTVYRNRAKDSKEWSELELTQFDPGKVFTLSKTDGSYSVRYTFTPISAGQTRFDYYEWTDTGELDVPFPQAALVKLKRILEAS